MNRESALGGFFTLLTKKVNVSEDDPNYYAIEDILAPLPDEEVYNFFKFYSESPAYFNGSGFTTLYLMKKAFAAFSDEISSALWNKNGLGEKVSMLSGKLEGVFYSFKKLPADTIEKILDKSDFSKFKNAETKELAFDKEEQQVILSAGFYYLYQKYEHEGSVVLKEIIGDKYKTLYTKKFFTRGTDGPQLGHQQSEDGIAPKTVSLFQGNIKRIQ